MTQCILAPKGKIGGAFVRFVSARKMFWLESRWVAAAFAFYYPHLLPQKDKSRFQLTLTIADVFNISSFCRPKGRIWLLWRSPRQQREKDFCSRVPPGELLTELISLLQQKAAKMPSAIRLSNTYFYISDSIFVVKISKSVVFVIGSLNASHAIEVIIEQKKRSLIPV